MTIISPTIKHLVVAGGAHMGFSYFGALKTLCQKNFVQMANIESIYATSVGTILAVFLSFQTDWSQLDNYIMDIQWNRLFPTTIRKAFMAVPKGGMFDISSMNDYWNQYYWITTFLSILLYRNSTSTIKKKCISLLLYMNH